MFQSDLVYKLKNKIYRDYPFFATISFTTEHRLVDSDNIIMGTDGKVIYINERIASKLDKDDLIFAYLHELLHIAFLHTTISKKLNLNKLIYSLATDVIINQILLEEEKVRISHQFRKKIVTEHKFPELSDKDVGSLTSLEVYDILYKSLRNNLDAIEKINDIINNYFSSNENKNKSVVEKINDILNDKQINNEIERLDNDLKDAIRDAIKDAIIQNEIENMSSEEKEKLKKEIGDKLVQSYITLKHRGKVKGWIERLIDITFKRVRDWKTLLREEIISEIKGDWTYSKISDLLQSLHTAGFRQIGNLPSLDTTYSIPKLYIAIDSSGSISDDEYKDFLNEIYSIFKSVNVNYCEVILFDYEIQKTTRLNGNYNKVLSWLKERKGYGGTELYSVINYLKNKNTQNSILIIFTDGYHEKLEPKDFKRFKKVIFVLSKESTKENIPFSHNIKIIKVRK